MTHDTTPTRSPLATLNPLLWLLGATLLAYHNTFNAPFVFDDYPHLVEPLETTASFDLRQAIEPRGFVRLSFQLNRWISAGYVLGFHVVNLGVHILAGGTLLALVWRTLQSPVLQATYVKHAPWLAFSIALLWLVHPLQTQSVTYIVQRYESMCGLFFLLTLYCLARAPAAAVSRLWQVLAIVSAWLCWGSKEIAIVLPLVCALYDRAFLSDSWSQSMRRMGLIMLLMWLPALYSASALWRTVKTSPTVGYAMPTLSCWEYAGEQPLVLWHYLRLSFWPDELCLDYGWQVHPWTTGKVAMVAATLLLVTICAWFTWRRPIVAFLPTSALLVLSVTSSFLPISDLAVEHRMYLPLAALIAGVVLSFYRLQIALPITGGSFFPAMGIVVLAMAAISLGYRTIQRNHDYRSGTALWLATVRSAPQNWRAWSNLATELESQRRWSSAEACYRRALALYPQSSIAMTGLGKLQLLTNQTAAESTLLLSLKWNDGLAETHLLLGVLASRQQDWQTAKMRFERALQLKPELLEGYYNLAMACHELGDASAARQAATQLQSLAPSHHLVRTPLMEQMTTRATSR